MSDGSTLVLGNRTIGAGASCFVIAEAGVNHNGSPDLAHQLIDAAADAGADAVKFQTFDAASLATELAPKAEYQARATGGEESQLAMLTRLELPRALHAPLRDHCRTRGLMFLSTPFDEGSADFLAELGVPGFKISSGDLDNHLLLRHVARFGRPVLLSTGMATLAEVTASVEFLRASGLCDLALFQCVSNYPAAPEDANLRAMTTLRDAFSVPVGFSDHTQGTAIAFAAVAMGAAMIEKHLTLDHDLPGPDHRASLEAKEFRQLVAGIRAIERAVGDGVKSPKASESDTRRVARRSLVAMVDIARGCQVELPMLGARRPAGGISPADFATLLGRTALRDIPKGTLLDSRWFE